MVEVMHRPARHSHTSAFIASVLFHDVELVKHTGKNTRNTHFNTHKAMKIFRTHMYVYFQLFFTEAFNEENRKLIW